MSIYDIIVIMKIKALYGFCNKTFEILLFGDKRRFFHKKRLRLDSYTVKIIYKFVKLQMQIPRNHQRGNLITMCHIYTVLSVVNFGWFP